LGAQFCPGCGRPVKPLKGTQVHESGLKPRTDQPLGANSITDTQSDLPEIAKFLPQRYRPERLIGQGGMGTVYLCHDQALERPVAIKIMTDRYRSDPQGERRFMREARAQAIVNHPNVATVLNFGVSPEGRPFLVMEYLEGKDLRAVLRDETLLEPMRACDLLRQACDGLDEAHTAGLVHRDMKPSNIMIVRDHRGAPWVKILDLGLAKIVGGQTDLKSITMDTAGLLVGTPAYMSPEQVAGASVDGRADIYALGICFFEMLTGRLPFESETMEGWLYQHLHSIPARPSQFHPALTQYPVLDKLTLWMLAKQPSERPATAGELAAMLRHLIDHKLMEEPLRPAKRSGPRPALAFEDNPPNARKSDRTSSIESGLHPDPTVEMQRQIKAAEEEALRRRSTFNQLSTSADSSETGRDWSGAIDYWEQSITFSDKPDLVVARIQNCRRQMDFEEQLSKAGLSAESGDWEDFERTLTRLSSSVELSAKTGLKGTDARIEQARAVLPKRLIKAWLSLAKGKLGALPEGDLRQSLIERLGIAYAQTGDMASAVTVLQDTSRKLEARIVGLAQGVTAAVQNGHHEGLRPYLERVSAGASGLVDPSERGRAHLETGRAFTAYGDATAAAVAFQNALTAFSEANTKGIPMQAAVRRTNAGASRRGMIDMRSLALTSTHLTGAKAIRASFEAAVGVVAQAQAEAGLVDDSMATTSLIEDAWTLAQCLSQVAQALARTGRSLESERVAGKITFALPKMQAYRAIAVSRVYSGDLHSAEEMLKTITVPADRIAIHGLLAAAWALRNDNARAESRIADAIKTIADVTGARARFQALLSAAEPLLNAGYDKIAEPLITEASKLIDLVDDPAERLRSLLQMGQLKETAHNARLEATRTMIVSHKPTPAFIEMLKRAMVIWRQVRHGADRQECVERLGHSIAWGATPDLASEMLRTCRDETELALAYIGLSTGMA